MSLPCVPARGQSDRNEAAASIVFRLGKCGNIPHTAAKSGRREGIASSLALGPLHRCQRALRRGYGEQTKRGEPMHKSHCSASARIARAAPAPAPLAARRPPTEQTTPRTIYRRRLRQIADRPLPLGAHAPASGSPRKRPFALGQTDLARRLSTGWERRGVDSERAGAGRVANALQKSFRRERSLSRSSLAFDRPISIAASMN